MPGMDGVELARHIRSLGMPRAANAHGDRLWPGSVMRAARSEGIETVLIKPVNALVLLDTLMQPLDGGAAAPHAHLRPRRA